MYKRQVLDTSSANERELLSNGQMQAAALATNALLNDKIDRVVYNVHAYICLLYTSPDEGVTRIVVAKNRSGPIGDVDLMFLPASTKFYELDGAHAEE